MPLNIYHSRKALRNDVAAANQTPDITERIFNPITRNGEKVPLDEHSKLHRRYALDKHPRETGSAMFVEAGDWSSVALICV